MKIKGLRKIYSVVLRFGVVLAMVTSTIIVPVAQSFAQTLNLPPVGTLFKPSNSFNPIVLKGISFYPNDPMTLDFIVDPGDSGVEQGTMRMEIDKLVQYFLASLTTPEEQMWVNLSPYESNRIIPEVFGRTTMGRDLLAQDYLLKQLSASLMHPDIESGEAFWQRIRDQIPTDYDLDDKALNVFHKIWIVPNNVRIYTHSKGAVILNADLKVLLEEDYLALRESVVEDNEQMGAHNNVSEQTLKAMRDVLLPIVEREVNEGETFSNLRQIYHSMILAAWYKKALRNNLLNQNYTNQGKTQGVEVENKNIHNEIYAQYVAAFKAGVYNVTKDEYDVTTQDVVSRKYFSGGVDFSSMDDQGPDEDEFEYVRRVLSDEGSGMSGITVRLGSGSGGTEESGPDFLEQQRRSRTPAYQRFEKNKTRLFTMLEQSKPDILKYLRNNFQDDDVAFIVAETLWKYINFNAVRESLAAIAIDRTIEAIVARYRVDYREGFERARFDDAIRDLILFSSSEVEGIEEFNQVAGHISMYNIYILNKGNFDIGRRAQFPKPATSGGTYIDLLTGVGYMYSLNSLDLNTEYIFVDRSHLVQGFFEEANSIYDLSNVTFKRQDFNELERPEGRVDTIRAKNIWTYALDWRTRLESMSEWLDEGGRIVLQDEIGASEDSLFMFRYLEAFVLARLNEGWDLEYDIGENRKERGYDTIILTKREGEVDQRAVSVWRDLQASLHRDGVVNARTMSATVENDLTNQITNIIREEMEGVYEKLKTINYPMIAIFDFLIGAAQQYDGDPKTAIENIIVKRFGETSLENTRKEGNISIFVQIVDFMRSDTDRSREFLRLLSQLSARIITNTPADDPFFYALPEAPAPTSAEGIYLDFGSEVSFVQYFRNLNPEIQYVAVESLSIGAVLREYYKAKGISNVSTANHTILNMPRPAEEVNTIRILDNVWGRYDGLENRLREILDWVSEGGQVIFQGFNSKDLARFVDSVAADFIDAGWTVSIETYEGARSVLFSVAFTNANTLDKDSVRANWERTFNHVFPDKISRANKIVSRKMEYGFEMVGGITEVLARGEFTPVDQTFETQNTQNDVAFVFNDRSYILNEFGAVTEFDGDQKRMTDEQKQFTRAVLTDFIRNNPESKYIDKVKKRLEEMDASALGGIDFNAALIDWQGDAVIMPDNNSSIFEVPVRYAPIEGLRPERIDIAPLKTMPHLLGLPVN